MEYLTDTTVGSCVHTKFFTRRLYLQLLEEVVILAIVIENDALVTIQFFSRRENIHTLIFLTKTTNCIRRYSTTNHGCLCHYDTKNSDKRKNEI